jgi:epoxyqueuosine reductase QueG
MSCLTAEFQAFAAEKRVDLLGIAPLARFADVPPEHHPGAIFPEAQSVIVLGKRITRGTLRGVEEGTQFDLYGQYGQSWLADRMLAITTLALATWLEDHGWEAVPLQDLPPEVPPAGVRVKPDLPPPNVMVDARQTAVRAGVGQIGWCGELLTPRFGPRQRLQMILTDAALEPTPLLTEPICDGCRQCAASCPLGAMNGGEQTVTIGEQAFTTARVDHGLCRRCHNGARPNPYHSAGLPDRLGALCLRTCVHHLESAGRISNTFAQPFRQRPAWQVDRNGQASLQD